MDRSPPSTNLELSWVYGYRANQCRNNIALTISGNLVYFVAGVAVIYDSNKKTQKYYIQHTDDLVSLTTNANGSIVATGQVGKEPFICVWDAVNLTTKSILKKGHQNGICCLSFDSSGERLASCGMDVNSTIVVWNWSSGTQLVNFRASGDRVFEISFHQFNKDVLISCGVKHVKFSTLTGNTAKSRKGIFGKVGEIQTILCIATAAPNLTYTGTLSGDIYMWKDNNLFRVVKNAHKGAVHSIRSNMTDSNCAFVSAGNDTNVKIWDLNFEPVSTISTILSPAMSLKCSTKQFNKIRAMYWNGDSIICGTLDSEIFQLNSSDPQFIQLHVQGHKEGELWALAIDEKGGIAATGSDDMTLRFWDISKKRQISNSNMKQKIRSVAFDSEGLYLAVGFINGEFNVLNAKKLDIIHSAKHRKEAIHDLKFSPKSEYLAVGSNDNFVDIYNTKSNYIRLGTCEGSSSFITHIDWSNDGKYIRTNSGASELLYYKVPTCKQFTQSEEIKKIIWKTTTGVLGSDLKGIWPKYSDTNDINALDTYPAGQCVFTADDFGFVKVFRYPCTRPGSKFIKFKGHSAHVTTVRTCVNRKLVFSIGGADHALFEWTIVTSGKKEALIETTDNEASDSDNSDVDPVDSDIEAENCQFYDREEPAPSGESHMTINAGLCAMKLKYTLGYRGYDCRNNLIVFEKTGVMAYHVAAVVVIVMLDQEHPKQSRFYNCHTDDIMSICAHPSSDFIATGQVGRDPAIHVWNVTTLKTISILKGHHSRGVAVLDFSNDGKSLASIGLDDDHVINIWDWKNGECLASARGHKDKIQSLKWYITASSYDIVSGGIKHIKFWKMAGNTMTSTRGIVSNIGKLDTTTCIIVDRTEKDVVYSTGASGFIYVWNKNNLQRIVKAHDGPCFSIMYGIECVLTGGKDGKVMKWNCSITEKLSEFSLNDSSLKLEKVQISGLVIKALAVYKKNIYVGNKHGQIVAIDADNVCTSVVDGHAEGELWGLACHPSLNEFCSVSDDCHLRIWSIDEILEKTVCIRSKKLSKSARCCCYSPAANFIAVGFKEGSFAVYGYDKLDVVVEKKDRKEEISDIRFSPDVGKYLAVASHDNFVDVYNVFTQKRVGVAKGASSYITHIDFDTNGKLIMLNSGAKEQLFFEAPRCKRQNLRAKDVDQRSWASWTCVLGECVTGIWPPKSDITDVNAVCLNNSKTYIATADDFGNVKIFPYPVKGKQQKNYKTYMGHSAHVSNVRWTFDDKYLISTGGADTSILVWENKDCKSSISKNSECRVIPEVAQKLEEYDSDVDLIINMNYSKKTYENPQRTLQLGKQSETPEKVKISAVSRENNNYTKVSNNLKSKAFNIRSLSLSHIFGYRGSDCVGSNAFYLDSFTVVYFAAATCIVHDLKSSSQRFFTMHTDDVLCLSVDSNETDIVASGQIGLDADICIWNWKTLELVSVLRGPHKIAVFSLNFSCTGKLLVSVSVDGTVAVWRVKECKLVCTKKINTCRIFGASFRPDSDTNIIIYGNQYVSFVSVAGNQLTFAEPTFESFPKLKKFPVFLSIAFTNNKTTYLGTSMGSIYVFKDLKLESIVSDAHKGPVFSLFTTIKDGLIVSGAKQKNGDSTCLKIWDKDLKKCKNFNISEKPNEKVCVKSVARHYTGKIIVGTQDNCLIQVDERSNTHRVIINGHGSGEMWGLCTVKNKNMAITASDDKTVRLWDLNKKLLVKKILMNEPVRCVDCNGQDLIAIGQVNGTVSVINSNDYCSVYEKREHNSCINDIKFSPQGKYLAAAFTNGNLDVFTVKELVIQKYWTFNNKISIIQVDYNKEGTFIKLCDIECKETVVDIVGKKKVEIKDYGSITWYSWNSLSGEQVSGVWPSDKRNTDINVACVSNSAKNIVTGDDFGFVKLYDFPCTKYDPYKLKSYTGHSAHVTNVKFTNDDKYLLSAGGDDSCLFVWTCER